MDIVVGVSLCASVHAHVLCVYVGWRTGMHSRSFSPVRSSVLPHLASVKYDGVGQMGEPGRSPFPIPSGVGGRERSRSQPVWVVDVGAPWQVMEELINVSSSFPHSVAVCGIGWRCGDL